MNEAGTDNQYGTHGMKDERFVLVRVRTKLIGVVFKNN